jgi:uncharacterized protein YutE (UPF0331/DUF86 family)
VSPGRVDRETVRRHLAALDAALARLRRFAGRSLAALRGDADSLWAVERGLQICAQNALDVGAFADRFRPIAGFRNLLVHGYLDLDVARLHRVLEERLDDFVEFAAHVERHLAQLPSDRSADRT